MKSLFYFLQGAFLILSLIAAGFSFHDWATFGDWQFQAILGAASLVAAAICRVQLSEISREEWRERILRRSRSVRQILKHHD